MCRWLAYTGSPVLVEDLLYRPEHSLIVQSMHSPRGRADERGRLRARVVRRPGDTRGLPQHRARLERPQPAELAARSPRRCVFAHIRASTGSPVQETNCHPFRHGRWLWMHNGIIDGFHGCQAGPGDGRRPVAVPRHRGLDRLRAVLLPRPDASASRTTRPRPWPGRSAWSRRSVVGTVSRSRCR